MTERGELTLSEYDTMFSAAQSTRTFEDIVGQIQRAIRQGELKPGDRLPSEREMQRVFGVSRATVREAIRVLEATGLISVRHGQAGAVINEVSAHLVHEPLDLILRTRGVTNEEIWEIRLVLETATARWAAERADEEQLDRLQKLAVNMAELSAGVEDSVGMWPELHQKDVEFHSLIAEASGNRLGRLVVTIIRRLVYEAILSGFEALPPEESARRRERMIEDHISIAQAIADRDVKQAKSRMIEHLEEFRTIIEQK